MNPLALELNSALAGTVAERLLSPLGKRLYFPRGIIAQSAEAKKSAFAANATIGTAHHQGQPLILSAVSDCMPDFGPGEIVAYAPTAGLEEARQEWKRLMLAKNKSLAGDGISLPVVVPGLTAGLSSAADLFLAEGESILTSGPCWDNYGLIFGERRAGALKTIPFFSKGPGLDIEGIGRAIREEAAKGAVRMVLNFPNNPSGYSPTRAEALALAGFFREAAENNADVLVICDDAYFGHFYEQDIFEESLFSLFANLHQNVLAVKIDGPIKEYYTWGLRIGFVTFASKGLNSAGYAALMTKLMAAIRSSVSCANTPAQHMLLRALRDPRTGPEKTRFEEMLQKRYNLIKRFLKEQPGEPWLTVLPFNSGYFMSFQCNGISAETLRRELLARHGIGVVALGDACLRVAFSSLDEGQIYPVYQAIYDTAKRLGAD